MNGIHKAITSRGRGENPPSDFSDFKIFEKMPPYPVLESSVCVTRVCVWHLLDLTELDLFLVQ